MTGLGMGQRYRDLVRRLIAEDDYTEIQAEVLALSIVFGSEAGILFALIDTYRLDLLPQEDEGSSAESVKEATV